MATCLQLHDLLLQLSLPSGNIQAVVWSGYMLLEIMSGLNGRSSSSAHWWG